MPKMEHNQMVYSAYESKSEVCPICDSELKYGAMDVLDACIAYPWKCDGCGASGKEYANLVFDGHRLDEGYCPTSSNNERSLQQNYEIYSDNHWQNDVMALAQKYGFVVKSAGGTAVLMTHRNQLKQLGESEYLRIQQMNGHCPKTFGYKGCLHEDGSLKECGSCRAVKDADSKDARG